MAATAVAALLGVAACSAAPKQVSIRSAGDSTPLAADPVPATTVDPTATTVEQPTVTTAPTVTTVPTPTTQPTSSTTAAVTATTAPVTASTVQPVTATTAAVTGTTAVTPTTVAAPALPQAASVLLPQVVLSAPSSTAGCPVDRLLPEAVDVGALDATLAAQGLGVPTVLFRDKVGAAIPSLLRNTDDVQKLAKQCFDAAGGVKVTLTLKADGPLAQAIKAQVDGLGFGVYLTPVALVAA